MATSADPFYGGADNGVFGRLLDLLNRLDRAGVHYRLGHTRPDSVMIEIAVPGSRWEVEFMADGSIDIERFDSSGDVTNDVTSLEEIFRTDV